MFADSINGVQILPPPTATSGLVPTLSGDGKRANWLAQTGTPGPPGPAGSLNATQGPAPWADVHAFGGNNRAGGAIQSTTATTVGGTPNVALVAAKDFVNGDGIVIYAAGAATSQSTPSAPVVTSPVVGGSTEYDYEIVGVDALGGLTAASAVGKVLTGPAVLSPLPVAISSVTQAVSTVTVNFSSPISASANQQITICGLSSAGGTAPNGVFTIQSAPLSTQITITFAPAIGTITVTNATGRLCNSFNITAISRTGNVVTVTTEQNHNFLNPGAVAPSIVVIDSVLPSSFNGQFVVNSPSGNTFTYTQGINKTETGSGGTATVYEYNFLTCPAYSGTTVQYYIYGRVNGSLALIGKTLPFDYTFKDWGPWHMNGFVAPSYVPTTPPVSAQNQLFAGVISSGAGTTSLVLSSNVNSSVSGAACVHDDSSAILAAATQVLVNGQGGQVLLSSRPGPYVSNYPITLGSHVNLVLGAALVVNETITLQNGFKADIGAAGMQSSQFGERFYASVSGMGNPMLSCGNTTDIDGIGIYGTGNGQNAIIMNGSWCEISNSQLTTNGPASVPLIFQGSNFNLHLSSIVIGTNTTAMGTNPPTGQISAAPPIPSVWFKSYPGSNGCPNGVVWDGLNNGNLRGIMVDNSLSNVAQEICYFFSNFDTFQSPETPLFMFYGSNNAASIIGIRNTINDSIGTPVFANWYSGLHDVFLDSCLAPAGSTSVVTGLPIAGLILKSCQAVNNGQNNDVEIFTSGQANVGPTQSFNTFPSGQRYVTRPTIIGNNGIAYPFAVAYPQLTGVTAVVSGAGTLALGVWNFFVTSVGWNGGESNPSPLAPVTVNGSQGVLVSWPAVVGVKGFIVRGDRGFQSSLVTPSASPSLVVTTASGGFTGPNLDGTGLPLLDSNQAAALIVRVVDANNTGFKADVATATLTGNQTATLPNASGNVLVEIVTGVGNGASGNIQAPAKSTGSGPTTPGTIVSWAEVNIGGTLYWLPLAQ